MLSYITSRKTVGSLAAYDDDFDLQKYYEFLSMSKDVKEKAGAGSKAFPGTLLKPTKETNLPPEVLELLVQYYRNTYDELLFVTLSNIHNSPSGSIVVFPKVNQFGRLRIGAEVIGSTFSAR